MSIFNSLTNKFFKKTLTENDEVVVTSNPGSKHYFLHPHYLCSVEEAGITYPSVTNLYYGNIANEAGFERLKPTECHKAFVEYKGFRRLHMLEWNRPAEEYFPLYTLLKFSQNPKLRKNCQASSYKQRAKQ